jgi:hypothetical protein
MDVSTNRAIAIISSFMRLKVNEFTAWGERES